MKAESVQGKRIGKEWKKKLFENTKLEESTH
jgi:hypothetical protein